MNIKKFFLNLFNKERREFPRISIKLDLKYRILNKSEEELEIENVEYPEHNSYTKNLSIDGISIFTGKERVLPGSLMEMQIYLPEHFEPVRVLGEVIWTKKDIISGDYFSGIEFISMKVKDFDRLSDALAEYFARKYISSDDKTGQENLKKIFIQFFLHTGKK